MFCLLLLVAVLPVVFASKSFPLMDTSRTPSTATISLLKLRGGGDSRSTPSSTTLLKLRGGGGDFFLTLPPAFTHTVVLGLVTNSLAILICNEFLISKNCGLPLWRVYAHNLLVTYVAYIAIFFLTGFLPMGYVPGAKPLVKLFEL